MTNILRRPRRLRATDSIRRLVCETAVTKHDLIYPMFVTAESASTEIPSMPGVFRYTQDDLLRAVEVAVTTGIHAIMLFGIPAYKDPLGSGAYRDDGIVPTSITSLKTTFGADLTIIPDVCLCEYTDHGHCGVIVKGDVENDATLVLLAQAAVCYAHAGADIIAPSDMMDGRIRALRDALDSSGFTQTLLLAYSAKYASGYYGPFRDAADSAPQFGDRRSYQMDPPNRREAIREIKLDLEQGADIVMVKPGLAYLDIVREVRDRFDEPLAVYNVSGEYSMVKAAARNGWIDEERVVHETMTAFKRAGADMILTYHAVDYAKYLDRG